MVVIDQARPERDQRQGGQEEQVGRVADLHDADAVPGADPEREAEVSPYRNRVLDQVAREPPRLGARPVAVDAHAAERLAAEGMLRGPRADDMHLISGGGEGQGLLPDPPVERHGKVLDQDQDMRALAARPSASRHRSLG